MTRSVSLLLVLVLTSVPMALTPSNAVADASVSPRGNKAVASAERSAERATRGFATPRSVKAGTQRQNRPLACYFRAGSRTGVGRLEDTRRYEQTYRCGARGITATDAQPADAPQVTEGDIRRAVSEIPMPSLQIQVQPGERTLVNVPTIFHTDPRTLRESVTLLGFDIDVEATPVRYTWRPGDGSAKTTTKPGRPYPSKDVTHTYRRVAEEVRPRVDTTYSVRYRVDGGAWQPLGQTLTAVGEPTSLEVEEAAPVLVTP